MSSWPPDDENMRDFVAQMVEYCCRIESEFGRSDPEWFRVKSAAMQLSAAFSSSPVQESQVAELAARLQSEADQHGSAWYEMLRWCSGWLDAQGEI